MSALKLETKLSDNDVACLIAFVRRAGGRFGNKEFEIMSKVDGKRSVSSYDHSTRALRTKATEIMKMIDKDQLGDAPATPAKKGKTPSKAAAGDSAGKTNGKKRASPDANQEAEYDEEIAVKKVKKVKTEEEDVGNGADEIFDELPPLPGSSPSFDLDTFT